MLRAYDEDRIVGLEIDKDDIEKCLIKLKNRKAPGVDGFTSQVIKTVCSFIPGHILELYRKFFIAENFPTVWKVANVVVLHKSSKKPKSDSTSYRPICVLLAGRRF